MLSKYIVNGGTPLKGEVNVSGSKNASVAIIPAVMLSDGICRLENVPDISDTATELSILYDLGADIKMINRTTYEIDPRGIRFDIIPHEKTKVMRGSYYFIGAMLGRFGKAKVALPGGCNFGVRPIDQHIKGFEALGCDVTLEHGLINVEMQMKHGKSGDMFLGTHRLQIYPIRSGKSLKCSYIATKGG